MNKFFIICCLLTSFSYAQQDNTKDAFLEKWQNSRDYLLEVAEAMPQEKYNYKPTERQMTFGGQLLHIRANMLWLGTTYFTEKDFNRNALTANPPQGKEAIIIALKDGFDMIYAFAKAFPEEQLSESVTFFAGPKSRYQILNLLQDHVTHHRGQLIVYLNMNEISPPTYLGW